MADIDKEIFHDRHFEALAALEMKPKDFTQQVELHLPGYTEKKRLLDGLKDFLTKVTAVEEKLYMVKAVGKVKGKMEDEEHMLINKYNSLDLQEKIASLKANCQEMIDQGRITIEERPGLQEQFAQKRQEAKKAEKPKLVEKYEEMLACVGKSEGISHPVANLEEFYPLHQELKSIERLERAPEKNLSDYDRGRIKKKPGLQDEHRRLERKSLMWFETSEDFQRRLQKALIELEKHKAEQAKKEAEEAEERRRRQEEEALEKKRQAHREAEERKAQELEARLESKRQEAALKPQKAQPQAKKKEKVHRTKLDPHDFFQPPPREEEEAVEGVAEAAEAEEEAPSTPPTNSTDAVPTTPETKPPAPKPAAKPKVAPKAKAPLPPSKWGKVEGAAEESPDEAVGPSLQEAAAVAATEAPAAAKPQGVPPPKKKEKKKFTKMAVSDLGFDANNPNYR
ncbi:unnamed protein product [Durusdinium trenchii]|uniref:Uncharacterized protein n=1 Tax=Durusdinium trenchii TaxID=1381693 RepID=A0ABP0PJK9_9DINO